MTTAPAIFRIVLQVTDIEKATRFYAKLLGSKGRRIHGARHYFDCGGVILALLNPADGTTKARAAPDYVYFSVKNLKPLHTRAKKLGCLSKSRVHGEKGGDIVVRPWGERSLLRARSVRQSTLLRRLEDALHRPLIRRSARPTDEYPTRRRYRLGSTGTVIRMAKSDEGPRNRGRAAAAAAILILLVGVVALLFWLKSTERISETTTEGSKLPSTVPPPADVARGDRTPATMPASGAVGSDAALPATKDAPPSDSSRLAVERLQAAIESSLSGVLDVEALLDSTLSLTNLPMQSGPPAADDKGTQQFQLVNPPPGVEQAQVWIGPASEPNGVRALSLRVTLQRQVRPYAVAGATRFGPEIDLTLITDNSGAFLEHRILTHLGAASSGNGGLASDVVEGVACVFDATGAGKNSMKFLGTRNGKPGQWDGPMALSGADPTDKWSELGKNLSTRLEESKKQ